MENNFNNKEINLSEANGGPQAILASKSPNSRETFVLAMGHAPQDSANPNQKQPVKLRCFKLTKTEGKNYLVSEFVNQHDIAEITRYLKNGRGIEDNGVEK